MRRLLLTARARADLGVPGGRAGVDARELVNDLRQRLTVEVSRRQKNLDASEVEAEVDRKMAHHYGPLIAFVRERSQQPEGQEWTKHLAHNYKRVYNLHSGENRGVTWWDRDRDVVWLLTAGFHRSGARDDFYTTVVELDRNHELMPDTQDFLAADPDPTEEYLRDLERAGRRLLQQGRDQPFDEHSTLVAGRLTLGVYIEVYVIQAETAEEVWIRIRATPDHHGTDVVRDILDVVIPEAQPEDIDFPQEHPCRPLDGGERIIRWACP